MSYLIQERNESCITYSLINQNPIDHYKHLFFTNGNGVDFVDGNPVVFVKYGRYIPWSEYYKHTTTFEYIKDYYIDYELSTEVARQEKNEPHYGDWDTIWTREIENLDAIEELTLEQLQDPEFWLECVKDTSNFFPYMGLSNGYFKLQEIDKNTDPDLIKIAIAVTFAYISFYMSITDNKEIIPTYKGIIGRWNDENINRCYDTAMSDLTMLTKEFIRLENI